MSNNNLVTKSDLGEFYGKILPYLNGQVPIHLNQFDRGNLYSTTEKMIGQWTDGRPVYQKTINFGALPNATTKTVAHGISNLGTVVKLDGIWSHSSNSSYGTMDWSSTAVANQQIDCQIIGNNISVKTGIDYSAVTAYITIQYTKTTDSALSVKYADANDYSTTEQIVGTWIDSKPLYQKTIIDTMPTITTDGTRTGKDIDISNLNIDEFIDIKGIIKRSVGTTGMLNTLNYYDGTTNKAYYSMANINQNNQTIFLASSAIADSNQSVNITIQYTKTT